MTPKAWKKSSHQQPHGKSPCRHWRNFFCNWHQRLIPDLTNPTHRVAAIAGETGSYQPNNQPTNRNEMKTCFHWTCFSFEQDLPVRSICCVGGDSISFVVVDSKNYFQQRNVNKIYYRSSRGWTLSLNWIILHSVEFTTAKVQFLFRLAWNSRNVSLIIAKVDIV